ncbi:MAG: tetraacyldisaccharide 4'-kinase [Gemmataceae bacterium]|nr:tetraacyldisaccharide 4'-kinase [Gemmataceae bacterium]
MRPETYHAIIRGQRPGLGAFAARAGFRLASWPYGLAMRARNALYERGWKRVVRAPVPVVSIGNLTLGGTGKTPCVEYVAARLRDRGLRPAILSRGYGAEHHRNDEAMVLEENLPDVPHLQGRDRAALAMTAVEELDANAIVLDDGFQHRRLARDLDLVLLDATVPLAREAIFPRGTLREPVAGLHRAHAIILTRCDQAADVESQLAWLAKRFPNKPVVRAVHAPLELMGGDGVVESLSGLNGAPVAAFCGIGNPDAFRDTLARLGTNVVDFRVFPDHHAYTREDVAELARWADTLPTDATVVATQKDWVKLRMDDLGGRRFRALRIGFRVIAGESELDGLFDRVFPEEIVENAEDDEDETEN